MTVETVRIIQRDNALVSVISRIAALRLIDAMREENAPFTLAYSTFAGRASILVSDNAGLHPIPLPRNKEELDKLAGIAMGDKAYGAWWLYSDVDHIAALRYTLIKLCLQAFDESMAALRQVEAKTLPVGMKMPTW